MADRILRLHALALLALVLSELLQLQYRPAPQVHRSRELPDDAV